MKKKENKIAGLNPVCKLTILGMYIVLIVLAWVVALTLISSGLKQITRLAQQKGNENQ